MANYPFNGSASQTVAFDAMADRVILNLNAADVASISQTSNSIQIVAASGAVLTLNGVTFDDIAPENIISGLQSDIVLQIGVPTDGVQNPDANIILGLDGDQTLVATQPNSLFFGNAGVDTLTNANSDVEADIVGNVRFYGGADDDVLTLVTPTPSDVDGAAADASLLVGGLGADSIAVGGAADAAYTGNVTVYGGNGLADTTDLADNITVTLADEGTALVYGNGGDDGISIAGTGEATVYGGQGDDSITAVVSGGEFFGGVGGDTIDVTTILTTDAEDGAIASVTVTGGNGIADAADGNDTITVTLGAADHTATIYANGGDDVIVLDGADGGVVSAYGGAGDDVIAGAVDEDGLATASAAISDGSMIVGGIGADTINVSVVADTEFAEGDAPASVSIFGGTGIASAEDDADVIDVALEANTTAEIYGNGGDDVITLTGAGDATVYGGQGNDTVAVEGTGTYTLVGGQGSDTFDFSGATAPVGTGTDATEISAITDFTFGEDTIDFGGSAVTGVVSVGVSTVATVAELLALDVDSDTNVSVVTVAEGDFAGSYAVYNDQVVEITGYTGTIDANAFNTTAVGV